MRRSNLNLNWTQFESCNPDSQYAFERMCRLLFNHYFFDGKAIMHSNPNNPGIEILPIKEVSSNKRISFQSKYLSTNDYAQIKHSAIKTIEHYEGKLDVLYLYCNRDLTTTSRSYEEIEHLLGSNGIELIPINNQTILDQVLLFPVIASYYFEYHPINKKWFEENLQESLDTLGTRHNNLFNVITHTEQYIDLFTLSKVGLLNLNNKKEKAIKEINSMRNNIMNQDGYLLKAKKIVESLEEITISSINTCLDWEARLNNELGNEILVFEKQYERNEVEIENLSDSKDNRKRSELYNRRRKLLDLIAVPELLRITETEKNLMRNKVLLIKGEAGVGKSQLFANASKKIVDAEGFSILLLGQSFLTNQSIFDQVISKLNLEQNFDDFLLILESIGEQNNQCITLFFDAINESANKEIWKINMNQMVRKLNKYNFLRMAFSLRSGYENSLLDESINIKIKKNEISVLYHEGFRNESIEATKEFLNGYNIPFSPTSFLQFEITNPLFLTLFCKTYSGEEINMLALFDNVIKNADAEIQKAIGYDGSTRLLTYLISEIIEYKISKKSNSISKQDLLKLEFWETHGISSKKIPFLSALEKTDILFTFINKDVEYYYLSYNLLEDFLVAKSIMNKHSSKEQLIDYIKNDLLLVDDNRLVNPNNVDVFIIISMLYAEKYDEECINIINSLEDYEKRNIISKYIRSFSMRKASSTRKDSFMKILQELPVYVNDLWSVLIENSTKSNHPLNANFLHELLIKRPLAERDAIWTTYINDLSYEEERLYQLVSLFHSGETLNGLNENNIKLLLTLFTWLLSSSNRDLRDKTSKAMIEILKNHFDLCTDLLEKFEIVDDPYIIQRLYGIIFGACVGSTSKSHQDFKKLTRYVYNSIFEKEIVYPDILLRDYARLIIERYLYEFADELAEWDFSKVMPPYKSHEIPKVEKENYIDDDKSGFKRIAISMQPDRIDGPGMYGDFGRYVFESALYNFVDVDLENIYHYSMQYIREELKYTDELFGEYDTRIHHPLIRGDVDRYERIGKKYQWIAMYHILARVSDTHQIKGDSERENYTYKGAYDPYVRDFDPTLNDNYLIANDIPKFNLDNKLDIDFNENLGEDTKLITEWVEADTPFFSSHSEKFIYTDTTGEEWVLLNESEEKKKGDRKFFDSSNQEQRIWSMSYSYLVKENQFSNFKEELMDKNFIGRWIPEAKSTYILYNGEYPWSYSCEELHMNQWYSYEARTGESYTVEQARKVPVFLNNLDDDEKVDRPLFTLEEQIWEKKIHKTKNIGEIIPTYTELTWEEEYDFSNQERHMKFLFPTKLLYDGLRLHQKNNHGYYYDTNDELIAFDGRLTELSSGLLIKKKQLNNFLKENKLKIFWTCLGEKQYIFRARDQIWSEWSGFLYLDENKVVGKMKHKKTNN
ncbi:hypothetical protein GTU75_05365 [Erysipelothrix rhusiopathiae]|nr:hypothetical protein [Erysipelothrix rhusiopathiae]